MARRPVKKRQKRKVVKKTTRTQKRLTSLLLRGSVVKKPKILNPKFKLEIGSREDPFFINPDTIPDGVALQWAAISVYRDGSDGHPSLMTALESGWKVVEEAKTLSGQVLVWAPKELARAQQDANIKSAQDQIAEYRKLFGMDDNFRHGSYFPLVSDSFLASQNYERTPSDTPPVDVEVKVNFRLSAHFQDAAACLKLAPEVYAQRRLDLYLRGELGGILLPVSDSSIELFENGKFNIGSRI